MRQDIPQELKALYENAIAWRHARGGDRFAGAGTVEVLIEEIADLRAPKNPKIRAVRFLEAACGLAHAMGVEEDAAQRIGREAYGAVPADIEVATAECAFAMLRCLAVLPLPDEKPRTQPLFVDEALAEAWRLAQLLNKESRRPSGTLPAKQSTD